MPKRLIHRVDLPDHLRVGWRGEEDAYFHLRRLGYVVVARNWRAPGRKGEIDIVAWDEDVLCFVEVKTRTSHDVKPAEAAVDSAKQRELSAMARQYLRRAARRQDSLSMRRQRRRDNGATTWPAHRFDVVSVYYDNRGHRITDITLFRNAFPLS